MVPNIKSKIKQKNKTSGFIINDLIYRTLNFAGIERSLLDALMRMYVFGTCIE